MIKSKVNITEDQLDSLHLIHSDANTSQRQIAKKNGFSLGKVDDCLKALIGIGFIKIDNFSKSIQETNYAYTLTPKDMHKKVVITKQFIIKKKQEYDKLRSHINK